MPPNPQTKILPNGRSQSQKQAQFPGALSGNPASITYRARRELNNDFIFELHKSFKRGGPQAINKVMRNNPAMYVKMLTLLVPREMEFSHSGAIKAMTDEQIERAIEVVKELIAKRDAGQNAKVIEHVATPVSSAAAILAKAEKARKRPRNMGKDVGKTEPEANPSMKSE